MQTKLESIAESFLNTISAYIISVLTFMYIVPLISGVEPSFQDSNIIVTIFTIISFLRNYIWRRIFNHRVKNRWESSYGQVTNKNDRS